MSAMLLLIAILFMQLKDNAPWWSVQSSATDANLRGVSVVLDAGKNDPPQYIIWASGSDGVILRSVDEGSTWRQISVPDADGLDFRDIEAFSADEAYVMSSGDGQKSRIYKTTDGGKTWKLQYSGTTPEFFLDSMACDSKTHCVALSDPVNGKFVVLSTNDGEHWSELPGTKCLRRSPKKVRLRRAGLRLHCAIVAESISGPVGQQRESFVRSIKAGHGQFPRRRSSAARPAAASSALLATARTILWPWAEIIRTRTTTSASPSTPMTPEPHGTSLRRNRAATGQP